MPEYFNTATEKKPTYCSISKVKSPELDPDVDCGNTYANTHLYAQTTYKGMARTALEVANV